MIHEMKRIGSIVVLLLASQLACAQWAEGNGEQLVIRGGWLFDGVSNERRPNTGIVIRNGKIVEVDADVQQQVATIRAAGGTDIYAGLNAAVAALETSKAQLKHVILLTDGQSNAGRISPATAADAASALDITVYTIGAGTRGLAPYPARDFFGNVVYQPTDPAKIAIGPDGKKLAIFMMHGGASDWRRRTCRPGRWSCAPCARSRPASG